MRHLTTSFHQHITPSPHQHTQSCLVIVGFLFVGLLFGAACSSQPESQPTTATDVTAFEGARLIAGDGSVPIEDSAFIVEKDRITQVGRKGELQVPAGAARVDLTGKTVMPAIIDLHTHMPRTRETLVDGLRRQAYWGIGAALSLGQDEGDLPFEMRENPTPGAALFRTAGRGIVMPGGQPGGAQNKIPYLITTEAEGRMAAQELAARKVDIVKIWVDDRNRTVKKLTPAMYGAIIDEAHKNNLRVTAHIWDLEDAKGLLRAGLYGFAHSVRDKDLDEEAIALFKERPNVFVTPNLPDPDGVVRDLTWIDSVPPEALKKLQEAEASRKPDPREQSRVQFGNLAKLNALGTIIALGTDSNTGWGAHAEMADMVSAGMTPAQVIVAATRTSAEILRLADHGTIAMGKRADFIVLDANPLDDITNTRRIARVYLRGTEVDRSALRAGWTGNKPQ
jgi:imidazolonepropionase-like amidohydrolase